VNRNEQTTVIRPVFVFQRQGCIHGEELPYIFGAPLVGGLMHFPRNYTKSEVLLSEAAVIYWSNFARTG
jgi:neuroligin